MRAYEHSSYDRELRKELEGILGEAGVEHSDNQYYLTPAKAAWSGPRHVSIEIRKNVADGKVRYFIHQPGNAYYGISEAKSREEAVTLLSLAWKNLSKD